MIEFNRSPVARTELLSILESTNPWDTVELILTRGSGERNSKALKLYRAIVGAILDDAEPHRRPLAQWASTGRALLVMGHGKGPKQFLKDYIAARRPRQVQYPVLLSQDDINDLMRLRGLVDKLLGAQPQIEAQPIPKLDIYGEPITPEQQAELGRILAGFEDADDPMSIPT